MQTGQHTALRDSLYRSGTTWQERGFYLEKIHGIMIGIGSPKLMPELEKCGQKLRLFDTHSWPIGLGSPHDAGKDGWYGDSGDVRIFADTPTLPQLAEVIEGCLSESERLRRRSK